jgi:hypothetical protein
MPRTSGPGSTLRSKERASPSWGNDAHRRVIPAHTDNGSDTPTMVNMSPANRWGIPHCPFGQTPISQCGLHRR